MTTEEKYKIYNEFRKKHGDSNFSTKELAQEFAKLKMDWWGSNLRFMGIQEKDGKFSTLWNVWD